MDWLITPTHTQSLVIGGVQASKKKSLQILTIVFSIKQLAGEMLKTAFV